MINDGVFVLLNNRKDEEKYLQTTIIKNIKALPQLI